MAQYDLLAPGPDSSHGLLIEACPPRSRVLDIGCGGGHVARELAKKGCTVWGIDKDARAVAEARPHCREAIRLDFDRDNLVEQLGDLRFDFIVMADILEHLVDPSRLLIQARSLLADGGSVGITVPNIAHASIRLDLLRGRFRRTPYGILDRTHIHHFTSESLCELLEECGFATEPIGEVRASVDREAVSAVARELELEEEKLQTSLERNGGLSYQLAVRARPRQDPRFTEELLAERASLRRQSEMLEDKVQLYADALRRSFERPHPLIQKYGDFRRWLIRKSSARSS